MEVTPTEYGTITCSIEHDDPASHTEEIVVSTYDDLSGDNNSSSQSDDQMGQQVLGYLEVQPSGTDMDNATIILQPQGIEIDGQRLILTQGEGSNEIIVVVSSDQDNITEQTVAHFSQSPGHHIDSDSVGQTILVGEDSSGAQLEIIETEVCEIPQDHSEVDESVYADHNEHMSVLRADNPSSLSNSVEIQSSPSVWAIKEKDDIQGEESNAEVMFVSSSHTHEQIQEQPVWAIEEHSIAEKDVDVLYMPVPSSQTQSPINLSMSSAEDKTPNLMQLACIAQEIQSANQKNNLCSNEPLNYSEGFDSSTDNETYSVSVIQDSADLTVGSESQSILCDTDYKDNYIRTIVSTDDIADDISKAQIDVDSVESGCHSPVLPADISTYGNSRPLDNAVSVIHATSSEFSHAHQIEDIETVNDHYIENRSDILNVSDNNIVIDNQSNIDIEDEDDLTILSDDNTDQGNTQASTDHDNESTSISYTSRRMLKMPEQLLNEEKNQKEIEEIDIEIEKKSEKDIEYIPNQQTSDVEIIYSKNVLSDKEKSYLKPKSDILSTPALNEKFSPKETGFRKSRILNIPKKRKTSKILYDSDEVQILSENDSEMRHAEFDISLNVNDNKNDAISFDSGNNVTNIGSRGFFDLDTSTITDTSSYHCAAVSVDHEQKLSTVTDENQSEHFSTVPINEAGHIASVSVNYETEHPNISKGSEIEPIVIINYQPESSLMFSSGNEVQHKVIGEPENCTVNKPEQSDLSESEKYAFDEPDERAINEPDESAINEPGENSINEPGESAVNEPDESAINEPDESAINEPDESAINEPDESAINEPDESAINEPDESAINEPDESAKNDLDGSSINELDESAINELNENVAKSAISEPEHSSINELENSVVDKPEPNVIHEPEDITVAKPRDIALSIALNNITNVPDDTITVCQEPNEPCSGSLISIDNEPIIRTHTRSKKISLRNSASASVITSRTRTKQMKRAFSKSEIIEVVEVHQSDETTESKENDLEEDNKQSVAATSSDNSVHIQSRNVNVESDSVITPKRTRARPMERKIVNEIIVDNSNDHPSSCFETDKNPLEIEIGNQFTEGGVPVTESIDLRSRRKTVKDYTSKSVRKTRASQMKKKDSKTEEDTSTQSVSNIELNETPKKALESEYPIIEDNSITIQADEMEFRSSSKKSVITSPLKKRAARMDKDNSISQTSDGTSVQSDFNDKIIEVTGNVPFEEKLDVKPEVTVIEKSAVITRRKVNSKDSAPKNARKTRSSQVKKKFSKEEMNSEDNSLSYLEMDTNNEIFKNDALEISKENEANVIKVSVVNVLSDTTDFTNSGGSVVTSKERRRSGLVVGLDTTSVQPDFNNVTKIDEISENYDKDLGTLTMEDKQIDPESEKIFLRDSSPKGVTTVRKTRASQMKKQSMTEIDDSAHIQSDSNYKDKDPINETLLIEERIETTIHDSPVDTKRRKLYVESNISRKSARKSKPGQMAKKYSMTEIEDSTDKDFNSNENQNEIEVSDTVLPDVTNDYAQTTIENGAVDAPSRKRKFKDGTPKSVIRKSRSSKQKKGLETEMDESSNVVLDSNISSKFNEALDISSLDVTSESTNINNSVHTRKKNSRDSTFKNVTPRKTRSGLGNKTDSETCDEIVMISDSNHNISENKLSNDNRQTVEVSAVEDVATDIQSEEMDVRNISKSVTSTRRKTKPRPRKSDLLKEIHDENVEFDPISNKNITEIAEGETRENSAKDNSDNVLLEKMDVGKTLKSSITPRKTRGRSKKTYLDTKVVDNDNQLDSNTSNEIHQNAVLNINEQIVEENSSNMGLEEMNVENSDESVKTPRKQRGRPKKSYLKKNQVDDANNQFDSLSNNETEERSVLETNELNVDANSADNNFEKIELSKSVGTTALRTRRRAKKNDLETCVIEADNQLDSETNNEIAVDSTLEIIEQKDDDNVPSEKINLETISKSVRSSRRTLNRARKGDLETDVVNDTDYQLKSNINQEISENAILETNKESEDRSANIQLEKMNIESTSKSVLISRRTSGRRSKKRDLETNIVIDATSQLDSNKSNEISESAASETNKQSDPANIQLEKIAVESTAMSVMTSKKTRGRPKKGLLETNVTDVDFQVDINISDDISQNTVLEHDIQSTVANSEDVAAKNQLEEMDVESPLKNVRSLRKVKGRQKKMDLVTKVVDGDDLQLDSNQNDEVVENSLLRSNEHSAADIQLEEMDVAHTSETTDLVTPRKTRGRRPKKSDLKTKAVDLADVQLDSNKQTNNEDNNVMLESTTDACSQNAVAAIPENIQVLDIQMKIQNSTTTNAKTPTTRKRKRNSGAVQSDSNKEDGIISLDNSENTSLEIRNESVESADVKNNALPRKVNKRNTSKSPVQSRSTRASQSKKKVEKNMSNDTDEKSHSIYDFDNTNNEISENCPFKAKGQRVENDTVDTVHVLEDTVHESTSENVCNTDIELKTILREPSKATYLNALENDEKFNGIAENFSGNSSPFSDFRSEIQCPKTYGKSNLNKDNLSAIDTISPEKTIEMLETADSINTLTDMEHSEENLVKTPKKTYSRKNKVKNNETNAETTTAMDFQNIELFSCEELVVSDVSESCDNDHGAVNDFQTLNEEIIPKSPEVDDTNLLADLKNKVLTTYDRKRKLASSKLGENEHQCLSIEIPKNGHSQVASSSSASELKAPENKSTFEKGKTSDEEQASEQNLDFSGLPQESMLPFKKRRSKVCKSPVKENEGNSWEKFVKKSPVKFKNFKQINKKKLKEKIQQQYMSFCESPSHKSKRRGRPKKPNDTKESASKTRTTIKEPKLFKYVYNTKRYDFVRERVQVAPIVATTTYTCNNCKFTCIRIQNMIAHYRVCYDAADRIECSLNDMDRRQRIRGENSQDSLMLMDNESTHSNDMPNGISRSLYSDNEPECSKHPGVYSDFEIEEDILSYSEARAKRKFGFSENDVVWVKVKNTYWPALVCRLYYKEKKASVLLIDSPTQKKGFKVKVKKILSFNIAEVNKKNLDDGQNCSDPENFLKAVQKAETYVRKRKVLECDISPKSFFGIDSDDAAENKYSSESSSTSDSDCQDDDDDDDDDEIDHISSRRKTASDLEDELSDDDEHPVHRTSNVIASPKYREHEVDRTKLLHCLLEGTVDEYLVKIYNEEIKSERHAKFFSSDVSKKAELAQGTSGFGHIDSDQHEQVFDYFHTMFTSCCSYEDPAFIIPYIYEVWIPEAIVKAISLVKDIGIEDAEMVLECDEKDLSS